MVKDKNKETIKSLIKRKIMTVTYTKKIKNNIETWGGGLSWGRQVWSGVFRASLNDTQDTVFSEWVLVSPDLGSETHLVWGTGSSHSVLCRQVGGRFRRVVQNFCLMKHVMSLVTADSRKHKCEPCVYYPAGRAAVDCDSSYIRKEETAGGRQESDVWEEAAWSTCWNKSAFCTSLFAV